MVSNRDAFAEGEKRRGSRYLKRKTGKTFYSFRSGEEEGRFVFRVGFNVRANDGYTRTEVTSNSVCSRSLINEPAAGPLLVNTHSFVAFSARATGCRFDLGARNICKASVTVTNSHHNVVATRTCGDHRNSSG